MRNHSEIIIPHEINVNSKHYLALIYIYISPFSPVLSCSVMSESLQPHSPPSSSVHGILQARMLEWVDISSSQRAN